jgi:uncharacterized protein
LASFDPPSIDFRLPLNHHDNPPVRHELDTDRIGYGQWYEAIFEEMMKSPRQIPVRFLSAIVHGLAGSPACDLFWGNTEAHIMVIEADGSYELVDNLKAIGNGLTKTGLGVHANSINDFVLHKNNWYDESKLNTVSDKCRGCKILHACRGSYYISRHSASAGFDRESVFCHDMQYLIPKMHATLSRGI